MTNEEALHKLWAIYQDIGTIAYEMDMERLSGYDGAQKLDVQHERLYEVFYELRRNLKI
jgi:hypothetical protein